MQKLHASLIGTMYMYKYPEKHSSLNCRKNQVHKAYAYGIFKISQPEAHMSLYHSHWKEALFVL